MRLTPAAIERGEMGGFEEAFHAGGEQRTPRDAEERCDLFDGVAGAREMNRRAEPHEMIAGDEMRKARRRIVGRRRRPADGKPRVIGTNRQAPGARRPRERCVALQARMQLVRIIEQLGKQTLPRGDDRELNFVHAEIVRFLLGLSAEIW